MLSAPRFYPFWHNADESEKTDHSNKIWHEEVSIKHIHLCKFIIVTFVKWWSLKSYHFSYYYPVTPVATCLQKTLLLNSPELKIPRMHRDERGLRNFWHSQFILKARETEKKCITCCWWIKRDYHKYTFPRIFLMETSGILPDF